MLIWPYNPNRPFLFRHLYCVSINKWRSQGGGGAPPQPRRMNISSQIYSVAYEK
jgi:hypothetical protein